MPTMNPLPTSELSRSAPPAPRGLRIGLFTDSYLPAVNGVAISLRLVAEALRAAGHQVWIFTPRYPGYQDQDRSTFRAPAIRYLSNPPFYMALPVSPRYTWALSRMSLDILHANSPLTMGMLAYAAARAKRIPLVYTYHISITDYTHHVKWVGGTRPIRRAARWFSRVSTNLADQVIVPSPKYLRLLKAQKVRKPIHLIPNGIDLETFTRSVHPSAGALQRRLGLPPETPIFLSVGRVDPEKNLGFLIEALAAFPPGAAGGPVPHLVIVGDGGARQALEAQAAASPVKESVHFLGMVNRSEVPGLLHDGTIFVSSSTSEVHPLAMIEALAAGLPVVAVADAAFEGMVENGVNGFQTPPDIQAFNAALASLLADHQQLKQFGQHSAALSRKFTLAAQVQALEHLYREAIGEKQLPRKRND